MRTIAAVTVGRSDYGLYRPLFRRLVDTPAARLHIIAGGMHLSPAFGMTVRMIEADGFAVAERVEMTAEDDAPVAIAESIGRGVIGFARVLARLRPDLMIVLGDRYEMYSAAVAAVPQTIPIAHIHGGELTEGAIDDALRHSMTKLSHLHFVATEEYARRVAQLGEEDWRITVSGAPGLDNVHTVPKVGVGTLERRYDLDLRSPFLLATLHPVTLAAGDTVHHVGELVAALDALMVPVVFTMPNADSGTRAITRGVEDFARHRPWVRIIDNLGTDDYFGLMAAAAAMIGNSSSGIIEAPSFELPVVNIGVRQRGRVRARNVIDVGYSRSEILAGLRQALEPGFRASLRGMQNPYGTGDAAARIASRLMEVPLDRRLIEKKFNDRTEASAAVVGPLSR